MTRDHFFKAIDTGTAERTLSPVGDQQFGHAHHADVAVPARVHPHLDHVPILEANLALIFVPESRVGGFGGGRSTVVAISGSPAPSPASPSVRGGLSAAGRDC